MKRLSFTLGLLITLFSACSVPTTEIPTRTSVPPTETLSSDTAKILPIGDGGLISDQPCASPCFFEIRIGETRLDQVISILENTGIFPCFQFNERIIVCGSGVFSIVVGANSSTFIVDGITYYPSVSISIENVLEKHGEPSFIKVESEGTPEASTMTMFILWDSIKMRIDLVDNAKIGEKNYVVERTTEVKAITFMDDSMYTELFANHYVQPWEGYGSYKP